MGFLSFAPMIISVIVTYNPEIIPWELAAVLARHSFVMIVDNSTIDMSKHEVELWAKGNKYCYLSMCGNAGIAAAQNRSIHEARVLKAEGIIFFDQDSLVDDRAITSLIDLIGKYERNVFCLIPGAHEPAYKFSFSMPIREMMSSGSGCQLGVFDRVGIFESDLFIDCVDFEWGWRCRAHAIGIFGVENGIFTHRFGKNKIAFMGFHFHLDSPIRGYYQFRNIVTMLKRDYVPLNWKLCQFFRSLAKFFWIALAAPDRIERLSMMSDGVLDGMRNALGPIKCKNNEKT